MDPGERAVQVLRALEELKSDEPVAAGARERLLARLIDFGFVCAVGAVLGIAAGALTLVAFPDKDGASTSAAEIDPSNPAAIATGLGVVTAVLLVEVVMLVRWGRTPGKRFMGLTVVERGTGRRPSIQSASIRTLVWGMPAALAVGFWWAAAISWVFVLATVGSWAWLLRDRERRAAHDLASGTRVLDPR